MSEMLRIQKYNQCKEKNCIQLYESNLKTHMKFNKKIDKLEDNIKLTPLESKKIENIDKKMQQLFSNKKLSLSEFKSLFNKLLEKKKKLNKTGSPEYILNCNKLVKKLYNSKDVKAFHKCMLDNCYDNVLQYIKKQLRIKISDVYPTKSKSDKEILIKLLKLCDNKINIKDYINILYNLAKKNSYTNQREK